MSKTQAMKKAIADAKAKPKKVIGVDLAKGSDRSIEVIAKPATEKVIVSKPKKEKSPIRKCCPTKRGQSEHLADCITLRPKVERKPKCPFSFDVYDAKAGRWPDGTVLTATWTGDEWNLEIAIPGKEVITRKRSGIHKLISQSFTEWNASRKPTNPPSGG